MQNISVEKKNLFSIFRQAVVDAICLLMHMYMTDTHVRRVVLIIDSHNMFSFKNQKTTKQRKNKFVMRCGIQTSAFILYYKLWLSRFFTVTLRQ